MAPAFVFGLEKAKTWVGHSATVLRTAFASYSSFVVLAIPGPQVRGTGGTLG